MSGRRSIPRLARGSGPIDWDEVHRRMQIAREGIEQALTPTPEMKSQILRARARALAADAAGACVAAAGDTLEIVEVRVSAEAYGLDSRYVREVYPVTEITPLPGTPPFVLGIINVRGRIVAINDLRGMLGIEGGRAAPRGSTAVLIGNEGMEFGILVEAVSGVRAVSLADLRAFPLAVAGLYAHYSRGVTKERTIVLDVERILTDDHFVVHEEVDG